MAASRIIKNHNIDDLLLKLFVIFLAWIFFFPEPTQAKYHIFIKLFLGFIFLIIILDARSIKFLFKRQHFILWIFLACISGGMLFAQDKQIATRAYSDISLTFVFIYYLTNRIFSSDKSIYAVVKAICIFSIIVALFGIIEYLTGNNPIYKYLIPNPYYSQYMGEYVRRPMSTQFNPVILGSFLLGCLPFALLLIKEKSRALCLIGIIATVLNIIVILLVCSRGVFLGMIALFLFYLWNKRKALSVLFLVFISIIIVICSHLDSEGLGRLGFHRIFIGSRSIVSEYRFQRVSIGLNMFKDYPFFGVGFKHFRIKFNEYTTFKNTPYEFKVADNMYLTLLSETGIVGFSGFFILAFHLIKKGVHTLYKSVNKKRREILLVVLSALIGLLVNMGGYELFYWRNPYAFFCILCGIVMSQSCNSNN